MSTPPAPSSLKPELDAIFSSVLPPSRIASDADADADAAHAAYRAAKAAYKEAKAVAKALRKREDIAPRGKDPHACAPEKAARKAEKERRKARRREREREGWNGFVASRPLQGAAVTVCGGKTCTRLGADAVAHVLRGAGKGREGAVQTGAPCMKMCGGVGPTLDVGGEKVKVDFRAAVLGALVRGEEAWLPAVTEEKVLGFPPL